MNKVLRNILNTVKTKHAFLDDVEDCGEEEDERKYDEQFIGELATSVFSEKFVRVLNVASHALELFVRLRDRVRRLH